MLNLRRFFTYTFITLIFFQILVLIFLIVTYILRAGRVTEDMLRQKRVLAISLRESAVEFLYKKVFLLASDINLYLLSYFKLEQYEIRNEKDVFDKDGNDDNKDDIYHIGKVEEWEGDDKTWYLLKDDSISSTLSHGNRYYKLKDNNKEICSDKKLGRLSKLQPIMKRMFEKYLERKILRYVDVEFMTITFKSGCFYVYPDMNPKLNMTKDKRCSKYFGDGKYGDSNDPRCMKEYIDILESPTRMNLTQPFLLDGKWMAALCTKSYVTKKNRKKFEIPIITICYYVNFLEFQYFQDSSFETEDAPEIMIVNMENNYIQVIYDSLHKQKDYMCKTNSNKNCQDIDLFNVYFEEELKDLYDKLSVKYINDDAKRDSEYNRLYNEMKNHDIYKKLEKGIINMMTSENITEVNKLNSEQLLNEIPPEFDIEFSLDSSLQSAPDLSIQSYTSSNTILLFPMITALMSGSRKETDLLEFSNITEFILYIPQPEEEKYNYFVIIRYKERTFDEQKKNLVLVVSCEIFLFGIYLIAYNGLVWFLFNLVYYYIIKGLLLPLKHIERLYVRILETAISNFFDKGLNKNLNSQLEEQTLADLELLENLENNLFSFMSSSSNGEAISSKVLETVSKYSQISQHEEIKMALSTLKAILIIIKYRKNLSLQVVHKKEYSKENFQRLIEVNESFIEATKFLSESFYNRFTEKENIDFVLLKLIIEHIFQSMMIMYKIQKKKLLLAPKNKIEFEHLLLCLNNIEFYYNLTKKAINRSKNELENIVKNTSSEEVIEEKKMDLFVISLLEEKLAYAFATHKFVIFEENLQKKYDDKGGIGDKIEDEEKKLLIKLQKKEKKLMNRMNSILYSQNTERDNMNSSNNDMDIRFKEEICKKLNFVSTKTDDDFLLNEEAKKYSTFLVNLCEEYLEIKNENKRELEQIIKKKAFSSNISVDLGNLKEQVKEVKIPILIELIQTDRSENILEMLKTICVSMTVSHLHILSGDEIRAISNFENALNDLRDFEKYIYRTRQKLSHDSKNHWRISNFTLLFINTIFYEKILLICAMLCNRFFQSKTELFINLNLLDFSPIYSKSIRKMTVSKIINFVNNIRVELVNRANSSIRRYKTLLANEDYIDIQRAMYKLLCLRNVSKIGIKKKILFVFDLSNKYIKDIVFRELIIYYFHSHTEEFSDNKFEYFFTAFDNKLYLPHEPIFDEDITLGRKYDKTYLKPMPFSMAMNLNSSDGFAQMSVPQKSTRGRTYTNAKTKNEFSSFAMDKIDNFFGFIKEYHKDKININHDNNRNMRINENKHPHRADKALYHAALFGFIDYDLYESNKITSYIDTYGHNPRSSRERECNYMILMTNLSATFTDNQNNWKEMADLIFEKKITVILVLSYDAASESDKKLREKISFYRDFFKKGMIDGYFFIMRSLSLLKYILNAIFPIKFSKFNLDIIKHYACSVENINHARVDEKENNN